MASPTATDAQYVQETVGPILAKAIAEAAMLKPENPINFVGKYLLDDIDKKKAEEEFRLTIERAKEHQVAWKEAMEAQAKREKEEEERRVARVALEAAQREKEAEARAQAEAAQEEED
ncbi:Dpy-30 motif [Carpediemonas membranifera]|uniref:Dpy-30 motif n=1 Tax=Carpediemonas membranifera TaxID=201153 RepID=A0A8J6E3H5_9EUKA|nr:Dpy-30 motif [Carpediemonas membranifera]|eukprot:KAG9395621.1 Dpy-30 motif [Carpediemonas membranifera]